MPSPEVLEIGIGGGANLKYFPKGTRVIHDIHVLLRFNQGYRSTPHFVSVLPMERPVLTGVLCHWWCRQLTGIDPGISDYGSRDLEAQARYVHKNFSPQEF
jgi:hypothetical protein